MVLKAEPRPRVDKVDDSAYAANAKTGKVRYS